MKWFFLTVEAKAGSTPSQHVGWSLINTILVYAQLIPLMYVIGYGFRLGFEG